MLDREDRPCAGREGYAEGRMARDPRGNLTRLDDLDVRGRPAPARSTGVAIERGRHDAFGIVTRTEFFDAAGLPCLSDGYARPEARYDGRRNEVEVSYLGADGRPRLDKSRGIARRGRAGLATIRTSGARRSARNVSARAGSPSRNGRSS